MKPHKRSLVLLAAIGVLVSACKRVQPPVVELTNVRFAGIGLRGASLIADLRIDNPNAFAIETDSITFELDASNPDERDSWTRVTSGTNRERLRVEPGDRKAVEVPIELSYADLSAPVRSVLDRGTFTYRVTGKVLVREPKRTVARFTQTGNLSMAGR